MPNLQMPDGAVVAFPDDMPKEQIRAKILEKFPDAFTNQPTLAARGAARGAAGMLSDANKIANTPVVGSVAGALFPPVQALRLAGQKPGGKTDERDPHTDPAMKKVTEFANAPTPSGAEFTGWAASQILPGLFTPEFPIAEGASRFMGGFARGWASKTGQQIPQAVQDFLAHHGLPAMVRRYFGVPAEIGGSKAAGASVQLGGRTEMGDERGKGTPQNNPPALPPYSGSPL